MGKVGSLGKIKFYVKSMKGRPEILSFSEMTREASVRYEEHPVSGKTALLEFIAPQPDQISMTIVARKEFGVKPHDVQKQLHTYMNKGTVCTFMLGGKRVGAYKWVITNLSDSYQTVCRNGKVTEMRFVVTLKEYRYKKKKSAAYTTSSIKNTSGLDKKVPKIRSYNTYEIRKGDTLWGLAVRFYGDGKKYTKIYNANKKLIKDPSKLTIGWVIKIPK